MFIVLLFVDININFSVELHNEDDNVSSDDDIQKTK